MPSPVIIDGNVSASTCVRNNRHIVYLYNPDTIVVGYINYYLAAATIRVAESVDGGATWPVITDVRTAPAAGTIVQLVLVSDSDKTLHVVWAECADTGSTPYLLYYSSRPIGGSWTAPLEIVGALTYPHISGTGNPQLTVDSNDKLHLTYFGWKYVTIGGSDYDCSYVRYMSKVSGEAWSSPSDVSVAKSTGSRPMFIAVNGAGVLYIGYWEHVSVVGGGDGRRRMYVMVNSGSGWSKESLGFICDAATSSASDGTCIIDSSGKLWFSYRYTYTDSQSVQVARRDSPGVYTTWEIGRVATTDYHQYSSSLSIDQRGDIHCVWIGKGWGTYTTVISLLYSKYSSGAWQAVPTVLYNESGINVGSATLVWNNYPAGQVPTTGYDVLFSRPATPYYRLYIISGSTLLAGVVGLVRVTQLRHHYEPGIYTLELTTGDVTQLKKLPGLYTAPKPEITGAPTTPGPGEPGFIGPMPVPFIGPPYLGPTGQTVTIGPAPEPKPTLLSYLLGMAKSLWRRDFP